MRRFHEPFRWREDHKERKRDAEPRQRREESQIKVAYIYYYII